MGFIFPKEIQRLILTKILEIEYSEKKEKILKKFKFNYFVKFKDKHYYRNAWYSIPDNKKIKYWTDIFINRYRMKTKKDFPINPEILYEYCEELANDLDLTY